MNDIVYKLQVIDKASQQLREIAKNLEGLNTKQKKFNDTTNQTSQSLNKTKKSFFNASTVMKGVFAAAIVYTIKKVGQLIGSLVKLYGIQEQSEMRVKAVLKATGNAIGMNINQLKALAQAYQKTTIYGDELILQGESLMLTFTKIGKDVFPQAMEAAMDMSATFGQDLKQSIVQLGTALNDPIQGIGRLRRIGVSFTEQQKELIKQYMEENNLMAAQKVILDELNKEFGGMSKQLTGTTLGALKQLSNAWGDFKEVLGSAFAPMIKNISKSLTTFLQNVTPKLANFIKNFGTIMKLLGQSFTNFMNYLYISIVESLKTIFNFLVTIGKILWEPLVAGLKLAIYGIKKGFITMINFIIEKINTVIEIANRVWRKVFKKDLMGQVSKIEVEIKEPEINLVRDMKDVWNGFIDKYNDSNKKVIEAYNKINEPLDNISNILSQGQANTTTGNNLPVNGANGNQYQTMNLGINYNELGFMDKLKVAVQNVTVFFQQLFTQGNPIIQFIINLIKQSQIFQLVLNTVNKVLAEGTNKILIPIYNFLKPILLPLLKILGFAFDVLAKAVAGVGAIFMWLFAKIKALGQIIFYLVTFQWGKLGSVNGGGSISDYYQQLMQTPSELTTNNETGINGINGTTTGVGASYSSGRAITININENAISVKADVIAGDNGIEELAIKLWNITRDAIKMNLVEGL